MKTLTLDLGTHVGWALVDESRILDSGTRHLATDVELETQRREKRERTQDIRFIRLLEFLAEKFALGVQRVVFEDVTFSGSPMQNQLWGPLRAAIWAAAPPAGVSVFCVPVTTLKVYATGNTRADKAPMTRALIMAEPGVYQYDEDATVLLKGGRTVDDNEVDAIWLARFTVAVDRDERDFLTAYQRKAQKREARRAKRQAAKAARKARKTLKVAAAKEKKRLLQIAVHATGRCCGVLRHLASRNRAICPKCNNAVKIKISADQENGNLLPPVVLESPVLVEVAS